MSFFARLSGSMFGSANLRAHLVRGAVAAGLLSWALIHQATDPVVALACGVAALAALRGCPVCWTMGLVETLAARRRRHGVCASSNGRGGDGIGARSAER